MNDPLYKHKNERPEDEKSQHNLTIMLFFSISNVGRNELLRH